MSLITEVVLFAGEWEHHPSTEPHVTVEQLTCRLDWNEGQGLGLLTGSERGNSWGGAKVATGNVYGAAFNYLRWDQFRAWLEALPWRYPEYVRVLVSREGDRAFALWAFTWPAPGCLPLQEPDLGLAQEEGTPAKLIEETARLMGVLRRQTHGLRPERLTLSRVFPFDGARS